MIPKTPIPSEVVVDTVGEVSEMMAMMNLSFRLLL